MCNSIQEAVERIKKGYVDGEQGYRQACEYLVANRGDLTFPVYIDLPGGMSGNADKAWETVKAGSDERCSCGNERVIKPGNPRLKFEASTAAQIVISEGKKLYIKPIGGDKASTYFRVEIKDGLFIPIQEPFAPFVFSIGIFSQQGYDVEKLATMLTEGEGPATLYTKDKIPALEIVSGDALAKTLTIVLDAAVEAFESESDLGKQPHQH